MEQPAKESSELRFNKGKSFFACSAYWLCSICAISIFALNFFSIIGIVQGFKPIEVAILEYELKISDSKTENIKEKGNLLFDSKELVLLGDED